MKRTLEQTLTALENQIRTWASAPRSPEIRRLDYPPEWEAVMLARIGNLVRRLAGEGHRVELEDVGQGFLATLERRAALVERLVARESKEERHVVHDLGVLASRYLGELFRRPLGPGAVCRLVVNTGALAAVTSYSAVMNVLHGAKGEAGPGAPTLVAFPLLGLRRETNYRTARI